MAAACDMRLENYVAKAKQQMSERGELGFRDAYHNFEDAFDAFTFAELMEKAGALSIHPKVFLDWLGTPEGANMAKSQQACLPRLRPGHGSGHGSGPGTGPLTASGYSHCSGSMSSSSNRRIRSIQWNSLRDTGFVPQNGKPRVLITGATGLLGREVYKTFEAAGWQVCGVGLSRAKAPLMQLDLFQNDAVDQILDDFKPDVLLHCAAERRPDKLENNEEWALKINSALTELIAGLCSDKNIWMVYLSTNYVFDGKCPPYTERDHPNPLNTYGKSKLAGEQKMNAVHPHAAILRVPLLYGPSVSVDESSVTQVLKVVQKGSGSVDNWQERYPTYTCDLAKVLEAFASAYMKHRSERDPTEFAGVFHWQSAEKHTKYTMAKVIATIAAVDESGLVPLNDGPGPNAAPRPQFEQMECGRLEAILGKYYPEMALQRFRSTFEDSMRTVLDPLVNPQNQPTSGDAY